MKNLQRGIRVLALLALFATGIVLFAQEATPEATPEATAEITTSPESTAETTESAATPEATAETTLAPEVTATLAPESTIPAQPTITEVAGASASVVGSGVVNPLFQALTLASGSTVNFGLTTTGTDAGFDQFCAGTADIATAIRTITVEEDAACQTTGVEYLELLIAYDVMVFVANNQDNYLACLTGDNINALFAPSASASTWDDIVLQEDLSLTPTPIAELTPEATAEVTEEPRAAISLYVPADNTLTYATLENLVAGFGLRDTVVTADYATIIANVRNNRGALGVVPLEAALAPDSGVYIVDVDFAGDTLGCTSPSIFTVEDSSYTAATPLYLYVNKAAQSNLAFFLDYLVSTLSVQVIADAGFSPASEVTYEINRAVVAGETDGRAFSAEAAEYIIPAGLAGTINVVGSTIGFRIADSSATTLTQTQTSLTINRNLGGEISGVTEFCAGTADILFVRGAGENLCDGNLAYVPFSLGYQAAVLISNAADAYASCLTLDQISTIWRGTSANVVTNWNALGESFPDQAITLVGVSDGSYLSDILLTPLGGGAPLPVRSDVTETNNNPLYRGAAIGIVSGSLAYMSWDDYVRVVESGQQNIQLVAVNSGSGCVVPSEASITDGTYPLARQLTMIVKTSSLATDPVQAYLWTVFSDTSYTYFSASGLTGIQAEDFAQLRADLLVKFAQAEEAALIAAESTAEATAESTSESTQAAPEATVETTEAAGE